MGMSFSEKFANGRFKFERSGVFGRGDTVYVYKDGEKIDEIDLDDSDIDYLKNPNLSSSDKQRYFQSVICYGWYGRYGCDL